MAGVVGGPLALAGILLLVGQSGQAGPSDSAKAAGSLDRVAEAARLAGIPFTSDEITSEAEGSSESSTDKALAELAKAQVDGSQWRALSQAVEQADARRTARVLGTLEKPLELAREAARGSKIGAGRDWDMAHGEAFVQLGTARSAGLLLAGSAFVLAAKGRHEEAAAELELLLNLAQACGREPSLSAMFTQVSLERWFFTAALRSASVEGATSAQVARYRVLVGKIGSFNLERALKGEAFLDVSVARNFAILGSPRQPTAVGDPQFLSRQGLPARAGSRAAMTRILEAWLPVFQAMKDNPGDNEAALEALRVSEEKLKASEGQSYSLAKDVFPSYEFASSLAAMPKIRTALGKAFFEVLGARGPAGQVPAQLPVGLADPMLDRPLGYRPDSRRFRIWSAGPDGKDDGGLTNSQLREAGQTPSGWEGDIAVVYVPVPRL